MFIRYYRNWRRGRNFTATIYLFKTQKKVNEEQLRRITIGLNTVSGNKLLNRNIAGTLEVVRPPF